MRCFLPMYKGIYEFGNITKDDGDWLTVVTDSGRMVRIRRDAVVILGEKGKRDDERSENS